MAESPYITVWKARLKVLESLLGKSEDKVMMPGIPIYLGGSAEVMCFKKHVPGCTYVTGGLIGLGGQKPNARGAYELMICTREETQWAPGLISRLAPYTHEAVLNWGETMDIGPAMPQPSGITSLFFTAPQLKNLAFKVGEENCSLVLCIGITAAEFEFKKREGAKALHKKLVEGKVYPYTDLKRGSVV